MKPIRILQVFTVMNRGGSESMIMNYYRQMDRSKVQFDFLVHREERGVFDDEIEALGGEIYRMPNIDFKYLRSYQNKLEKFFNSNNNYNIVHSHLNALSVYVLKKAKEANIPIRIAHSHIALEKVNLKFLLRNNTSITDKFKAIFKNYLKIKITKYATHYFACGLEAGEWLYGKKELKKIRVINNAIDAKFFEYDSDISGINKKELNIDDKFVIGHVGRFNLQKNHEFLIDIFKEVKKAEPRAVLLLLGDGDLKESIQLKVEKLGLKNCVYFLGVKSDIPYYLQAFDVFLFPSLYEGLPVTLIEAQASGLKTIVSDQVSSESKLSDLIEFKSLNSTAKEWAFEVLKYKKGYHRHKTFDIISNKGYDIKRNAFELQKFYLDNVSNK